MTSEIKDEFKAPLDRKEKEYLGKKKLKLSSIKEKMNNNNKNAITPIDEFDISKMSDMSNFVYEMDKSQKDLKISNKISDKKEEKDFNTSLDLSDDA